MAPRPSPTDTRCDSRSHPYSHPHLLKRAPHGEPPRSRVRDGDEVVHTPSPDLRSLRATTLVSTQELWGPRARECDTLLRSSQGSGAPRLSLLVKGSEPELGRLARDRCIRSGAEASTCTEPAERARIRLEGRELGWAAALMPPSGRREARPWLTRPHASALAVSRGGTCGHRRASHELSEGAVSILYDATPTLLAKREPGPHAQARQPHAVAASLSAAAPARGAARARAAGSARRGRPASGARSSSASAVSARACASGRTAVSPS
jgi:hypothetical protein